MSSAVRDQEADRQVSYEAQFHVSCFGQPAQYEAERNNKRVPAGLPKSSSSIDELYVHFVNEPVFSWHAVTPLIASFVEALHGAVWLMQWLLLQEEPLPGYFPEAKLLADRWQRNTVLAREWFPSPAADWSSFWVAAPELKDTLRLAVQKAKELAQVLRRRQWHPAYLKERCPWLGVIATLKSVALCYKICETPFSVLL